MNKLEHFSTAVVFNSLLDTVAVFPYSPTEYIFPLCAVRPGESPVQAMVRRLNRESAVVFSKVDLGLFHCKRYTAPLGLIEDTVRHFYTAVLSEAKFSLFTQNLAGQVVPVSLNHIIHLDQEVAYVSLMAKHWILSPANLRHSEG